MHGRKEILKLKMVEDCIKDCYVVSFFIHYLCVGLHNPEWWGRGYKQLGMNDLKYQLSANQLFECLTYKDIASSEDIKLKFCGTQLGKTRQMFFSFLSSDLGRDGCFCFRFLSCKERSMLSEFARC